MLFDRLTTLSYALLHSLRRRWRNDSLLRNSIYVMSTTAFTAGIGYLYWIVATHLYSIQNVGLGAALFSAMTLTSTLANLGIGSTLVHLLPRRTTSSAWSLAINAGLVLGTIASLLASGIVVAVLPMVSTQFAVLWHHASYASLFILGVVLLTISTLLDQIFVAERVANNMFMRNAVFALFKLPLMIVMSQMGVLGMLASWVLANIGSLLLAVTILLPHMQRTYRLAFRGMIAQIRAMLSLLVGNHFINIGGMMPAYLVPILVIIRLSAVENAYFYTTKMVGGFFYMISPAIATALFAEGVHTEGNVLHKARNSALITCAILTPAMLAMFLGGHFVLSLFGPNYALYGLPLLMIMIIETVPDAITNIYVSVLRVQNHVRRAAFLNMGMGVTTLLLAWFLLPIGGIVGAGAAFAISQFLGSIVAGIDFWLMGRQQRQKRLAVMNADTQPDMHIAVMNADTQPDMRIARNVKNVYEEDMYIKR